MYKALLHENQMGIQSQSYNHAFHDNYMILTNKLLQESVARRGPKQMMVDYNTPGDILEKNWFLTYLLAACEVCLGFWWCDSRAGSGIGGILSSGTSRIDGILCSGVGGIPQPDSGANLAIGVISSRVMEPSKGQIVFFWFLWNPCLVQAVNLIFWGWRFFLKLKQQSYCSFGTVLGDYLWERRPCSYG